MAGTTAPPPHHRYGVEVDIQKSKLLKNDSSENEPSSREHLEDHATAFQALKRRKVSSFREFPKGCGRYAPNLSDLPLKKRVSSIREFPNGCGRYAPNLSELPFKKREGSPFREFPNGCDRHCLNLCELPIAVAGELPPTHSSQDAASTPKSVCQFEPAPLFPSSSCQMSRTRISAIREFPFGCGRNAKELTVEECENLDVQREEVAYNSTIVSPTKFTSAEAMICTPKSLSISTKEDQPTISKISESDERDGDDIDYFRGKEIVLGLMAAPNCPWMNGRAARILHETALSLSDKDLRVRKRELSKEFLGLKRKLSSTFLNGQLFPPTVQIYDKDKNAVVVKDSTESCDPCDQFDGDSNSVGGDVNLDDILPISTPKAGGGTFPRLMPFKLELPNNEFTNFVASTNYDDGCECLEVLVYTDQEGGLLESKNQKLELGNMRLENCIEKMLPVKVVHKSKESKNGARGSLKGKHVYTYTCEGFYKVEKYREDWHPPHDALVYKFLLRRLPGQLELASKIVKEVRKSIKSQSRVGICVEDISEGKEKFPISVVNTVDDERPPPFEYITEIMYPPNYQHIPPRGCLCKRKCSDSKSCLCAVKNGGEIPFNDNGAIVEAKRLVYECGPTCKCPASCHNRVSQHGIKFPLEVFKTKSRGWGVRASTFIPSGSFICEYIGEVLRDMDADQLNNDEYLFDIGNNYYDQSLWEGLSTRLPDLQTHECYEFIKDGLYAIDACRYGNVGRFINHSCSPNLYAQNVLYDHDDISLPHIMMFSSEDIPPFQELTYHYNYMIDQVRDSKGNIKRKDCYCGSEECDGRLY